MIRVAIIAASPLARAGLTAMLPAPEYETIAAVPSIDALEESLDENAADVILLDSPDSRALTSIANAAADSISRSTPLILLTPDAASNRQLAPTSYRNGTGPFSSRNSASPFAAILPNHISSEQLRAAINAVALGFRVALAQTISIDSASLGTNSADVSEHTSPESLEPLTPRERQVLQMLASGLVNKEIAARLNISEHTAKFHVAAILGKLGAGTRTEAVTIAIRHGLVLL